jgi:hypothetical protein
MLTLASVSLIVTDALDAILNTCTKEELEESDDDETFVTSPMPPVGDMGMETRQVIIFQE